MRFYHSSKQLFGAEKSSLAVLRKKTGYTIANCKKALQLNDNDLGQAEKWLKDQAQIMGWKKATKLEGRLTSQGLIGVAIKDSCAAMIELSCETDFVAKNKEFKSMVEIAANSCVDFASSQYKSNAPIIKICFSGEQLKELPTQDGKKLSDLLALMIGTVGENATFKRALCFKAGHGVYLAGYAHPSGDEPNHVQLGKFGSILAFRQFAPKEVDLNTVGKELCQHIVGMNPKKLGTIDEIPSEKSDYEDSLLHQEYLLDESITVKDYLEESGVEVIDFRRFQCGESMMESGDQPLELIETCQ
ncbi:hypothetical protein WA026_006596 [Henosepilachna vigintioctopunctata]